MPNLPAGLVDPSPHRLASGPEADTVQLLFPELLLWVLSNYVNTMNYPVMQCWELALVLQAVNI